MNFVYLFQQIVVLFQRQEIHLIAETAKSDKKDILSGDPNTSLDDKQATSE